MQQSQDDRSIGDLFSELSRETSTLVRQEVALAKTEMSQKASRVGKDVGLLTVGGAVAYAGFLGLMAALILLLGEVIDVWLAALIVGLIIAGVGGYLVQKGLDALKHENLAPQRTIETLKEDKEWAKRQVG